MRAKIKNEPERLPLHWAHGAIGEQLSEISDHLAKIRIRSSNGQSQFERANDELKILADKIEKEQNEYWRDLVAYPHLLNLKSTVSYIVTQYGASESLPIIAELVAYSTRSYDDLKTNVFDQLPGQYTSNSEYKYRKHAFDVIGPLLTPGQVAGRLGVSVATVNNWRKQNRLLGVRFDKHQYLYPVWQFVESPDQGEHGVLRYVDQLIILLGDAHPWVKARFFLKMLPRLGGKTVLQVLRDGNEKEIEFVLGIAEHQDELGSGL